MCYNINLIIINLLFTLKQCAGVIYHLNNSEYYRMPPLSALDLYDECLHQPGGLYCLARFDLVSDPPNEVMTLIREYSKVQSRHFNHTYVDRGVCVTKSCRKYISNQHLNNSEDINKFIEKCVNESIWNAYKVEAKLSFIHNCDRLEDKTERDTSDWIVAGLITALVIINIICTICDTCFNNNIDGDLNIVQLTIRIFSIRRNWGSLISESADSKATNFTKIDSLKVIMMLVIFIPHVLFLNSSTFTDNTQEFEKAYDKIFYQIIFNGSSVVDFFFLISGYLMVHNLQMKTQHQEVTWATFAKLIFLRWTRLSASYAITLAFSATWLRHLGSGPLWKYSITNSVAADCRRNWWLHLLYINNYLNSASACAVHTWHTAADLQLFAVGLVAYILSRTRVKYVMWFMLMMIGLVAPVHHVWYWDLDGTLIFEPELYRTLQSENFRWLYVPGHIHLPSFIVGMLLAFLVYRFRSIKYLNRLSKKGSPLLLCCFILLVIRLNLVGRIFYEYGERPSLATRMLYAAIHRLILSIVFALSIVALGLNINKSYWRVFSWHGWSVLNKLTYTVFLIHLNIVNVMLGSKHQLGHVSEFNTVTAYFAVASMSYLMALPLYLMAEAPIVSLAKALTGADTSKRLAKKVT